MTLNVDSVPGGHPEPEYVDVFGLKYRYKLEYAVQQVVLKKRDEAQVLAEVIDATSDDHQEFLLRLRRALDRLGPQNCARFRIPMPIAEAWARTRATPS